MHLLKPLMQHLTVRIQDGDSLAETELYLKYQKYLRKYFIYHLGMDWEDIFQETMIEALVRIRSGQVREPEKLTSYILSIARNHIAEYIRKRVRYRDKFQNISSGQDIPMHHTPESLSIEAQEYMFVNKAMAKLTPLEQSLLTGFYMHNKTSYQLEQELNLSCNSFRLRKFRAKKKLVALVSARLTARTATCPALA